MQPYSDIVDVKIFFSFLCKLHNNPLTDRTLWTKHQTCLIQVIWEQVAAAYLHSTFTHPARDCGAAKLSRYFAAILSEDCSLPDHRNDPEIASIYDEKLRLYDEEAKK